MILQMIQYFCADEASLYIKPTILYYSDPISALNQRAALQRMSVPKANITDLFK